MLSHPVEMQALRRATELEAPLVAVESRLGGLGQALLTNDANAIEQEAAALHQALADAITHFSRAARHGGVPPVLRHRLAVAGGQVAAQREALARATASLDRAIDVLLPGLGGGVYNPHGGNERAGRQNGLMA